MKKIKYIIPLVILFIAIGFAAISYTLNLEGNAGLAGDLDNFNVYYSNTYVNGVEDYSVITTPTELDFTTTIKEPGTTYSITYDVTNGSKHFDAELTMTCTSGDAYMSVVNNFDTSTNLEALGTRSGTITIKKLKSIASETNVKKTVSCTITATPVERTSLGTGTAIDKQYAVLKATTSTDTTMFRSETYKEKIKTITFQDEINIPADAIESWDIGVAQNGNVMAYVVTNTEDTTMYDLYIQADGKVYANRDMSYWFASFTNVKNLNGLEYLDTSTAVNMSYMFYGYGRNVSELSLDLTPLDTSNVTSMGGMFEELGYKASKIILDLSSFDTSKVINMVYMFDDTGYFATDFTLDVSNFDTSSVDNMNHTFNNTGHNSLNFQLDISDLDTSNVKSMNYMFSGVGYSNPDFTLDVSSLDTTNVTNMNMMFYETGYKSKVFTLDVSNFDTSNVVYMSNMFSFAGYSSPIFTLNLGDKFVTNKVTTMRGMFYYTGYNSTELELDISRFDTSLVTDMVSMFYNVGQKSSKINTSITIRNPDVEDYTYMFVGAVIATGSQITVNYTSETESLVDAMIATKSSSSNVIKGSLVK